MEIQWAEITTIDRHHEWSWFI